jgi:hypothetical protein
LKPRFFSTRPTFQGDSPDELLPSAIAVSRRLMPNDDQNSA